MDWLVIRNKIIRLSDVRFVECIDPDNPNIIRIHTKQEEIHSFEYDRGEGIEEDFEYIGKMLIEHSKEKP